MQVKRYCCADVREALRLIRRDLGPDAVVIGTRERPDLPGGRHGRPLIEVTAAVDPDGVAPAAEPADGVTDDPRDRLAWLVDVLCDDGLDRRLAGLVVAEAAQMVPDDLATTARLRAAVAVVLRRRTRVAAPPWATTDPRLSWFVGPAGAGKTTTLAKVAAFAAWQERRRVAVVSLDTARPGATARLAALLGAMEVPLHEARDAVTLRETVARLSGCDQVLIDTPPPGPGTTLDGIGALVAAAPGRVNLCLPADGATRSLLRAVGDWAALGVDALIATRTDQAATLGAAFAAHHALERPLTLLTSGPAVPDDVEIAAPDAVCRGILVTGPEGDGSGQPRARLGAGGRPPLPDAGSDGGRAAPPRTRETTTTGAGRRGRTNERTRTVA